MKKTVLERTHLYEVVGECWVWTGATNARGYGVVDVDGQTMLAHRAVFSQEHPDIIIEGYEVCHSCDNPPCIRPLHLWVGTRAQNAADMVAKDRKRGRPSLDECVHGHQFTDENTYVAPKTGIRGCVTCRRDSSRQSRQREREVVR